MTAVKIAGGSVVSSRLGFGCAGLHRLPSFRERERLLGVALELGIRHFDVAPIYGLGRAESELGAFARGRREHLSIATKCGLDLGAGGAFAARVQRPIRVVAKSVPGARKAIRRAGGTIPIERRFDRNRIRASVERSLRRLGTDYIDILFLHEPSPEEVTWDVIDALDEMKRSGSIKSWGVSAQETSLLEIERSDGNVPVPQVSPRSLVRLSPSLQARGVLTFGVLRPFLEAVALDGRGVDRSMRGIGGEAAPPANAASAVQLALALALDNNPHGSVIVGTTSADHLRELVVVASKSDVTALAASARQRLPREVA